MGNAWVVIDEIKKRVTLPMIFDHYGLTGKGKGTEVRLECPFHDDEHPSLSASLTKGAWQCFGCHEKGDSIAFVVLMEGIETGNRNQDRREAALYLAKEFGIESPRSRRGKSAKRAVSVQATEPEENKEGSDEPAEDIADDSPAIINPPLQFELKGVDPGHPYLKERGLTDETIATFGLGYFAGRGSMHERIVVPIHSFDGQHLLAYAGRWPGQPPEGEPKYKFPPNFHKSLVLYNLHRAKEYAGDGLIVVEGFFTVFDLWQKERRNVVAVMGSHLSPEQEKRIVETVGPKGKVLIAFDPDPAGRKGMQAAAARLSSQVFVRTVELSE